MSKNNSHLFDQPLDQLIQNYPVVDDFLEAYSLPVSEKSFKQTIKDYKADSPASVQQKLTKLFSDLLQDVQDLKEPQTITQLEVHPGKDKNGNPEQLSLTIKAGQITCIVGPTGSGKSRLLADIEWLANKDTPTSRKITLNGYSPDEEFRNQFGGKLIAQITQNMNFVMDTDVYHFLILHAQSRFLPNAEDKAKEVIEQANKLSGEPFSPDTPITFLSGGQSRALMIADVAIIGQAPIILIDEIENAGVNKRNALDLLIKQDKIVLMATHDPLLILQAHQRVIIKNGGISNIIQTTSEEKILLRKLEKLDKLMETTRQFFRKGKQIDSRNSFIDEQFKELSF